MQDEINAGRDLDTAEWQTEAETMFQGFWDRAKNKLQETQAQSQTEPREHPAEIPTKTQEMIDGVFGGIREDVDMGRDVDLAEYKERMGEQMKGWWSRFKGIMGGG